MITSSSMKVNSMEISWFSVSFVLSDALLVKQQKKWVLEVKILQVLG